MRAAGPKTLFLAGLPAAALLLSLTSCRSAEPAAASWGSAVPPAPPRAGEGPTAPGDPVPPVLQDSGSELPAVPAERVDHHAPNLYRRFGFSVGGAAYANFDTSLRLDAGVVGTTLDLEDFLGVKSSSTALRLDADYSFNKKHRIDLSFYDIGRDGKRTIAEDIQVGEVIIPAGDVVTKFDTQILKLAYRYNFVTDYRTTLGASLGFHTMRLDLGVSSTSFNVSETFKATAPLPLLGLHGAYALSDKWRLRGSFEVLQLKLNGFEGFISDTVLAIDHDTFDHFGWGIGFNGFNLDMEIEDKPLTADIEYGYQGLMIYLRTFF